MACAPCAPACGLAGLGQQSCVNIHASGPVRAKQEGNRSVSVRGHCDGGCACMATGVPVHVWLASGGPLLSYTWGAKGSMGNLACAARGCNVHMWCSLWSGISCRTSIRAAPGSIGRQQIYCSSIQGNQSPTAKCKCACGVQAGAKLWSAILCVYCCIRAQAGSIGRQQIGVCSPPQAMH